MNFTIVGFRLSHPHAFALPGVHLSSILIPLKIPKLITSDPTGGPVSYTTCIQLVYGLSVWRASYRVNRVIHVLQAPPALSADV